MDKYYKVKNNNCWEWQMAKDDEGYGRLSMPRVKNQKRIHLKAHRWMYENIIGKIPDKLVIDHLCRNTSCVNPSHMEPVTIKENTRRGIEYRKLASPLDLDTKPSSDTVSLELRVEKIEAWIKNVKDQLL